jgi:hypothetical protein
MYEQVKFISIAEYGTLREKCFRSELVFTRLYRIAKSDYYVISVRPYTTNSGPTRRIFIKFNI